MMPFHLHLTSDERTFKSHSSLHQHITTSWFNRSFIDNNTVQTVSSLSDLSVSDNNFHLHVIEVDRYLVGWETSAKIIRNVLWSAEEIHKRNMESMCSGSGSSAKIHLNMKAVSLWCLKYNTCSTGLAWRPFLQISPRRTWRFAEILMRITSLAVVSVSHRWAFVWRSFIVWE